MNIKIIGALATLLALVAADGVCAADTPVAAVPKVRAERPRLVLRDKAWDGPSVERLKGWLSRPEYQQVIGKLRNDRQSGALRYLALGDQEAGNKCVAWLKGLKAPSERPKDSPSYTGEELLHSAMVYDWLRGHPDFQQPEDRAGALAYFEWWGDYFKRHNSPGVVPFYSRNAGACLGLAAIAIAIHGDSPRAPEFLAHAYRDLVENVGTIRQIEDGATGGATYGYVHVFNALAHAAAAWRAGTDWDAAHWIREQQGNWLERQMLWQIWATYPNGWFWKEGDVWSSSHRDRNEMALNILAVSDMYKNGYGRAHLENMHQRWGMAGCYYGYRFFWFFLYNNPDVKPLPLDGLGRFDVFSPKLHGYVCMRDSWADDATIIHFKTGENVDHHGTWDTGKFTIFKHMPLAIKSGGYDGGYMGMFHHYYKLPWSANCVIFDNPKTHGWQPRMPDGDGHASWADWKAWRDKSVKHPPTGVLLASESNKDFARALADLSGSTYPSGSTWTRELVFLGYKYLLVLDRVKPGAETTTRWLLQSWSPAAIDAVTRTVTIDYDKGRLFCRTLLPEKVKLAETGLDAQDKAYGYPNAKGDWVSFTKTWFRKPEMQSGHGRVEITPEDPAAATVYLHALFPTDSGTATMPPCSVQRDGEKLTVKVGELQYIFQEAR
jgi:hypothetical protein